ncbi:MAG: GIY-YIG nuclease family protein [Rhodanobacter sp.]
MEQHYQPNGLLIDAALLGKIALARFLVLPLRAVDRLVAQVESSAGFTALLPWMSVGRLEGARVAHEATDIPRIQASPILGEVHAADRRLMFLYHREAYAREYRFDEEGVNCLMARAGSPAALARTLRRLRLINTRNRLTHALMQAVLAAQAAYLRSGQDLALLPLTQATISARLRSESNLSVVADAGRISRLVRGLSIALPNGKAVPLNTLFPKPRQVHCHFVDHMLKAENTWIAEGLLREPLTDEAVAALLEREHGIRLSRRTVANIRHDLAIPDSRSRGQRMNYLVATEGFSPLVPLTPQVLRTAVPTHPGVYEIRATAAYHPDGETEGWPGKGVTSEQHGVVYIGSAGDLRKRLGDHLRGSSDNALLYRHIADGAARVRFRLISADWRVVERELYRVFCETFGVSPQCNRMSP